VQPVAPEPIDPLLLYRVRDRVFRGTPGGRRATDLFYLHSGDIVHAMRADPALAERGVDLYLEWQPLLRDLVEGRGDQVTIPGALVDETLDVLADLEAVASPDLREAIERERESLDLVSLVGKTFDQGLERLNRLSCEESPTALCLSEGRFRVEVEWQDFEGHTGKGRAASLTPDTGTFWFFDPANVELIVKVLDARTVNDHFWVFYGALSNVRYTLTVTDTLTGAIKTYFNPENRFASAGDTIAFADSTGGGWLEKRLHAGAWITDTWASLRRAAHRIGGVATTPLVVPRDGPASAERGASSLGAACVGDATHLCLNGNRFRVGVTWQDFEGNTGSGRTTPLTGDTGAFWFFDPENVELVLKVLDGRALNGHFWVYYGALSNVEYTITVTDTLTGRSTSYRNPANRFASAGDTTALPGG
jgi:hypothetical protein